MTENAGVVTSRRIAMERQPGELLSPLKAIRSKCLDCCCGSVREVALCPVVAARVQALREEMAAHCTLTRQEALEILTRIARGELSTYLDDDGHVDPRKVKALGGPDIQSLETSDREGAVRCRLRLRDPIRAIDLIARMCGWYRQSLLAGEGITITINTGEALPDEPGSEVC